MHMTGQEPEADNCWLTIAGKDEVSCLCALHTSLRPEMNGLTITHLPHLAV
jgi:hypothetical protein